MKLVVGAAIVRGSRVLAARRTAPAAAAGRWEFPGGKVEAGESPEDALVREIGEEFGCGIEVTGWLAGRVAIGETHQLAVGLARLSDSDPEPTEHDEIRWLSAEEVAADHPDGVDWLEPDRPFLAELADVLRGADGVPLARAVFFEAEDAEAVRNRLRRDGFDAELVRERFAGEDDDEDHPWAVLTDAPEFVVEVLIEEYDGWLDQATPEVAALPPLTLPDAPRRIKRPRP